MTKAEFQASTAKTPADKIAQQLLRSYSPTSLKELKRALNGVARLAYEKETQSIALDNLQKAVETAMFYILD